MLKMIFLPVLYLITNGCFAQLTELDSLLIVLKNHPKEDSTRLILLNEIAYAYSSTDPQKGLESADKAIELAQKLNDRKKLASAFSNKGVNFWAKGDDSMALKMYRRALFIHQSYQDQSGIAVASNNIGLVAFNLGDYVQAVDYHLRGLRTFEQLKDSTRIAAILANIGVDYQYLSDYPKALDYYFKALRISESTGNRTSEAHTLSNIGLVYKNFAAYVLALKYQNKALALYKHLANKQGVASTLGNIGVVYNLMGKQDTALAFYQKALVINKEVGNKRRIASDLTNIGIVHKDLKKYLPSLIYLKKALDIYEELDDKNNIALNLTQIGNVYTTAPNAMLTEGGIDPGEKFVLALTYQNRALKLSKEIQAVDRQSEVWLALAETYEAKNDFANALNAYKNYTLLHDSIISDEKKQYVMQKGMQFTFEKKEDSLKIENAKKHLLDATEIKRQKSIRQFILWSGIILFVAGFTIFVLYKRKKDAQQKQKEAELKAEVADTEMKALRAQMNPHFIFNSLNSIGDFIARNEYEKADKYLTSFAKLIRKTLENSEKRLIPLAEDLKVLRLYLQLECKRLDGKFDFMIKVADEIDQENTLVPPMILQPFVENSIWHGIVHKEGKGNITVNIERSGDMLLCFIDDDGIGRKASSQLPGVAINQSLGMKITKSRIDMMNTKKESGGNVELSDLAHGMRVQVSLPLELSF